MKNLKFTAEFIERVWAVLTSLDVVDGDNIEKLLIEEKYDSMQKIQNTEIHWSPRHLYIKKFGSQFHSHS